MGELGGIPYQVAVTFNGFPTARCGGTIISPLLILTAAQCVKRWHCSPGVVNVIAGTREPSSFGGSLSSTEQIRTARTIHVHPGFSPIGGGAVVNDIALVVLNSPLQINEHVSSIPLPLYGDEFEGKAMVSGWGRTDELDPASLSNTLKFLVLPIVPFCDCQMAYGEKINGNALCAGEDGKGTCNGDTGGPAVCKRRVDRKQVLCGIISWAAGCGRPNYPTVFTKVSSYIPWIQAVRRKINL